MATRLAPRWLEGKTAVIVDASSEVGQAFALALARRGTHLRLITHSPAVLCAWAATLSREHVVQVDLVEADLAGDELAQPGCHGDMLLLPGEGEWQRAAQDQPQVGWPPLRAADALTEARLSQVMARGQGVVIQVVNVAADQPLPPLAAPLAWLLTFHPTRWAASGGSIVQILTLRAEQCSAGWIVRQDQQTVALLAPTATPAHIATVALQMLDRGRSRILPALLLACFLRCGARLVPGAARVLRSPRAT